MIIQSENILLRLTTNEDEEIKNMVENVEELFSMSETRLYPQGIPKEMQFRIEKDGELIGDLRLIKIRWFNRKAELSIILKKEFHGQHYGEEAMRSIIKYAFEKMNLHRLEAEVIEYNKVSIALVEKLGFKLEGTLREGKFNEGKFWNIFRFGLLVDEYKELK